MKEKDFYEKLAVAWTDGDCTCTPKEAAACWDKAIAVIMQGLKQGEEVITSIGKFKLNHKPAGEARNPKTGEKTKTPAKAVPKFAPNKKFKDEVMAVKAPKK